MKDITQKKLKPFDHDTFSGEWNTRSKGKVTDFNLMLKHGTTGSIKHKRIESGQSVTFEAKTSHYFLYFVLGTADLGHGITAKTGDLFRIENNDVVTVRPQERCDIIEIIVSEQRDFN